MNIYICNIYKYTHTYVTYRYMPSISCCVIYSEKHQHLPGPTFHGTADATIFGLGISTMDDTDVEIYPP